MSESVSISLIDLAKAIDNIDHALSILINGNQHFLCRSIVSDIYIANEKLIDQICHARGECFTVKNRSLLLTKAIGIRQKASIMKEMVSDNSAI
ncbi:hypothetical protein ACJW8B_16335 [Plesiomonas shigelloides]|uniref:hypothetical protein n=1 Tax=Bacteria TaxID=2 RepID=UPI00387F1E0A